jgi:hypothetical protein
MCKESIKQESKQAGMNHMPPGKKVVMLLSKRAIEWEPGPDLMNRPFGPKSTRPLSQGSLSLSLAPSLAPSLSRPLSFSPCISASTHQASILPQGYKSHMPVMHPQKATNQRPLALFMLNPNRYPHAWPSPPTHGMAMSTHPYHGHIHPSMAWPCAPIPSIPGGGSKRHGG